MLSRDHALLLSFILAQLVSALTGGGVAMLLARKGWQAFLLGLFMALRDHPTMTATAFNAEVITVL